MKSIINVSASGILTCASYLVGGFDMAIISFGLLMVIDYLTGILKAWKNKEISSEVGAEGIIKKATYILAIIFATVVDRLVGNTGVIRTSFIYFLVSNEGLSIIENCCSLGLKFPPIITNALEQIKNKK